MVEEALGMANGQQNKQESLTGEDERLTPVLKELSELAHRDGQVVSLTPQQLSLLQQFIHHPDSFQDDPMIQMCFVLEFEDDDERRCVMDAYAEARELGMDISWNIRDAISRAATPSKMGQRMSRVQLIGEILTHSKFTTNYQPSSGNNNQGGRNGGRPNSPLG